MKARTLRLSTFGIVLCAAIPLVFPLRSHSQSAPPRPVLEVPPKQSATPAVSPKSTAPTLPSPTKPSTEPAPPAGYYESKLSMIVFPSVAFQESSMDEVIEFLRAKSIDYDKVEKDPSKKGVNIILQHDANSPAAKVTLSLKDVPMRDVLKYVTLLGGMTYKVEPYAVVVMPLSKRNTEVNDAERSPQPVQQAPTPALPPIAPKKAAAKPLQSVSKPPVQPAPAGAYYAEKMNRIIFPKVEFMEASVDEIIDLFRTQSREYDNAEKDPAKRGVNLVLKHDATTPTVRITLSLRDVPMSEALRYVTQLAGMAFRIEPFAVVVMPLTEWNTQLHTRIFRVPPDFLTANATAEGATAIDILKAHGIPFPAGASATFIASTSQLVVKNTEAELWQVEALIQTMVQVSPSASSEASVQGSNLTQITAAEGGRVRAVTPGENLILEAESIAVDGRASRGSLSTRTQQILRDAELRVLMRHFETTVSEITDGERTLQAEANVAQREALEAKLKALRAWKTKLAESINALAGTAGSYN